MGVGALGERVRAGDRDAFAELYAELADRLFGFCVVLLRDRDEAADAAQDAFVLAVQRASQLRDPDRLHAWLFAIARHVCFRRLKQRQRVTPSELPPDVLVLDEDPTEELAAAEAAALVWDAAGGLSERDRVVLYLHTREGLEGAELAAALGLEHANPYSMLHRARAQLERSVNVLLVARENRRRCASLSAILDGWDGALTPLLRKRVGRHLEECASCQQARSNAARGAVFAVAPLVKPERADALSAGDLLRIAAHRPAAAERWQPDGFPPPMRGAGRRRRWLVAAAALLVLLVALLGDEMIGGATKSSAPTRPATAPPSRPHHVARVRRVRPAGPKTVVTVSLTTTTTIARVAVPTTTVVQVSAAASPPTVARQPTVSRPSAPTTTAVHTTTTRPLATTTTRPPATTTTGSFTTTTYSF